MILRVPPEELTLEAMEAVLSIDKTVSALPPDERVAIVAESVLGVLREFRLLAQKEPERQRSFDALCGDLQAQ